MRILRWAFGAALVGTVFAGPAAAAPEQDPAKEIASDRGDAYFHLMKARMAASRGRGNETVREIQAATDLEPASAPLYAEGANLLAQIGRRDEAEKLARRALELDAADPVALRTLADLLAMRALGSGRDAAARAEAIKLYGQLRQTTEPEPQVYQILTNLMLVDGDLPGAIDTARRYAEKRPADAGAAKLLTQLLVQDGKTKESLTEALKFVAANPYSPELIDAVTELADRSDGWAEVERALSATVQSGSGGIAARMLVGESLLRQGRAAESVPMLEAAREAGREGHSQDPTVHALLGEAYVRSGRAAEAVVELETALAAGPTDPVARLHLATAYAQVGRLADASATAKALAGDYPGNPAILIVLGESLSRQGLVEPAVDAFAAARDALTGRDDSMVERRDDLRLRIAVLHLADKDTASAERALGDLERKERPEALEVRARVALAADQPKEARPLARKLRAKGETGLAELLEGQTLLREGRPDRAEARFAAAIAVLGSEGREESAALAKEAGQPELAERILRDWVRVEPGSADAAFALGRFLERTGRFPEAEELLRKVLALEPKNAEALNYLGYSLVDRNVRIDEASALIEQALAIDPWNGAFLDSLGWARFQSGQYDKARELLERASREFPRDAVVLEHLGDLYEKLGEAEKAGTAWEKALKSSPANPDGIREKLARVRSGAPRDARDRTDGSLPETGPGHPPAAAR